jgi:hypothetical protein
MWGLPPDPNNTECIYHHDDALAEWVRRMAFRGRDLVTPIEHNSFVGLLAHIMDVLSHPADTTFFAEYYGPLANPATAAVGKVRVRLHGVLPRPEEPERRTWWDACAEISERLGGRLHMVTGDDWPATIAPTTRTLRYVTGPAVYGIVPESRIEPRRWIKEDPDLGQYMPELTSGIFGVYRRLRAIADGDTRAEFVRPGAAELAVWPQVQQIADIWRSQNKNFRIGTGAVLGLGGATAVGATLLTR